MTTDKLKKLSKAEKDKDTKTLESLDRLIEEEAGNKDSCREDPDLIKNLMRVRNRILGLYRRKKKR